MDIPAREYAKRLLLGEMKAQKLRPSDLARLMGVRQQEVTRILKLSHATKIETVEAALKAVGKTLTITLKDK